MSTRRALWWTAMVAGIALWVTSVPAEITPPADPGAGHFDRNREGGVDRANPVPVPEPPRPQVVLDEAQLIGFTTDIFPGDRGVLNYTLACQAKFGPSRMCTFEEVNRTLDIPRQPGFGHAWVNVTHNPVTFSFLVRQTDGTDLPITPNNCNGWISSSSGDHGLAMDLGHSACFGGWRPVSCERQLVVACCAQSSWTRP